MRILDLQQILYSNLFMANTKDQLEFSEDLVRHMVLNSIRASNMKFRSEFGDLVIACDNKHYWRKDVFPYYKASRKKQRDKSPWDWPTLFAIMDQIRSELKEHFPYRIIDVEKAEADDIIATLCERFGNTSEKILIVSGDKDYIQLQTYLNVQQYDPIRKRWITHNNPEQYRMEHIMKGDVGDGIPNIMSPDDVFVTGGRSRPLREARIAEWSKYPEHMPEEVVRNFKRNEQLIDLSLIPDNIKEAINKQYDEQNNRPRGQLINYFIKKRLKFLMEKLSDF